MRRAGPAPDGGTAGSVEILIRIVEDTTPRGGGLDSDVWETEDHAYWQRVRLLDQVGPSRYEIEYICDDENEDDDSGGDDDDHDSIDDSGVGGSDRHTGADDNESEDAAACDHEPPSIQFETDGTPGKLRLFEPPNTAGQLLDWTGTLPSGMIEVHATPAAAGETARRKQRTAASTTSECSSKADGEFEDVIDVERRAFERGKVEGARDMHSQKFKEGFEFGEERGFADGFEIGSVHGFTQAVQDVFELLPATVVRKKVCTLSACNAVATIEMSILDGMDVLFCNLGTTDVDEVILKIEQISCSRCSSARPTSCQAVHPGAGISPGEARRVRGNSNPTMGAVGC